MHHGRGAGSPGDRYTGSGRFSVSCSSGGYFFHPDYRDDREVQPDVYLPIPQPCKAGDTVTVDGFHTGSGGLVAAGGLGGVQGPHTQMNSGGFEHLCDGAATAAVTLQEPVAYNGMLTFGGAVNCRGANVRISSVTINGLAGWPYPVDAGSAECHACRGEIGVSNQVPARWTEWDVTMRFAVSRPGNDKVQVVRVGRYVTTWAGHVTQLYPEPRDDLQ